MKLDLYEEIKSAVKDAIKEFYDEMKHEICEIHSKDEAGDNLLTVKQFVKKHPFVSESSIRSKCFNSQWNKFNICISRVGRKVLIKEKIALDWFTNPPPEAIGLMTKKSMNPNDYINPTSTSAAVPSFSDRSSSDLRR